MDIKKLLDSISVGISAVPLPDHDCNNGVLLRLFSPANESDMEKALENALSSGFSVYSENEIEHNRYVTLTKEKTFLHIYFIPSEKKLRLIADGFTLPFPKDKTDVARKAPVTLWMFETDHTYIDCGMCFVIRCADNSFFLIDSGHFLQLNDHKRLYRFLRERTPDGEKIVINGWFITHAHDDHVCKCIDFIAEKHSDVSVEAFYYNTVCPRGKYSEYWGEENIVYMEAFDDAAEKSGIPIVKLHSGQRLYIRGLTIDVLCTHEDVYPKSLEDYNNSSTVLMIEAEGCRICIPGDAGDREDECLMNRFGEKTLRCDVMQLAHHGHFGLSSGFYKAANAKIVLVPNTQVIFEKDLSSIEASRVALSLSDSHHIASNGTVEVPIPYSPDTVRVLPDETFENFDRIKALWGYEYTDEKKQELFEGFLKRSGLPDFKDIKP
ncbi:MAG: hypothetical protein K6F09_04705 [Clostridiales bacterium]|nr:hypothetical protein [Clostridiales bacterium]